MLADLHNHVYGEENELLLAEIRKNSPDFVCLAGDMLIGHTKIPYDIGQQAVMELAKENCELFHSHEQDENLETYFINLVGGGENE